MTETKQETKNDEKNDEKKNGGESTPPITIGARGLEFPNIPALMSYCRWLANKNFIPYAYKNKPDDIFCAVWFGLEHGLTFWQSLTSVCVINSTPSLYGPAFKAMADTKYDPDGRPIVQEFDTWYERDGERLGGAPPPPFQDDDCAVVVSLRQGRSTPLRSTYSVADAKHAKLWGKTGKNGGPTPWVTHPADMMYWRALGRNYKRNFPGEVKGLIMVDEAHEIVATDFEDVTPSEPQPGRKSHAKPPPEKPEPRDADWQKSGVKRNDEDEALDEPHAMKTYAAPDPGPDPNCKRCGGSGCVESAASGGTECACNPGPGEERRRKAAGKSPKKAAPKKAAGKKKAAPKKKGKPAPKEKPKPPECEHCQDKGYAEIVCPACGLPARDGPPEPTPGRSASNGATPPNFTPEAEPEDLLGGAEPAAPKPPRAPDYKRPKPPSMSATPSLDRKEKITQIRNALDLGATNEKEFLDFWAMDTQKPKLQGLAYATNADINAMLRHLQPRGAEK